MEIDLAGRHAALIGDRNVVADAVADALAHNGAHVRWESAESSLAGELPVDVWVVSHALKPDATDAEGASLMQTTAALGRRMAALDGGRIVVLLSALGVVPMRRHPDYSAATADSIAGIRGLAMEYGPHVLLNAVGVGLIRREAPLDDLVAGDPAMLSHVPLARAGRPDDVTNAVLFVCDPLNSYMTGQVLAVDGGWTAGYARNF